MPAEDDDFTKEVSDAFAGDDSVVENPSSQEVEAVKEEGQSDDSKQEPTKQENLEVEGEEPEAKGETPENSQTPETPAEAPEEAPEAPAPLTIDDITKAVNNIRAEERSSVKELDNMTKDVLDAYYPEGLSDVLVDQNTGKELRTPQDVVEASNNEMDIEQATQWLLNEKHRLNENLEKIRQDARGVAETTVNFRRDSMTVLQKYQEVFEAKPQLQSKVFEKLMKQVKYDKDKGVILSSPDVVEFYDDYLEPYMEQYAAAVNNPTPSAPTSTPTPTVDDRLDEGGDGGVSPVDDPNDFAQQVNKELAKGI